MIKKDFTSLNALSSNQKEFTNSADKFKSGRIKDITKTVRRLVYGGILAGSLWARGKAKDLLSPEIIDPTNPITEEKINTIKKFTNIRNPNYINQRRDRNRY